MPIEDGMNAVRKVMEPGGQPANIPPALHQLRTEVQKRAKEFLDCYPTCRDNKGDRCLAYQKTAHENDVWQIGIMFLEYVAGLLIDKAKKGHCYAEATTKGVCSRSRTMHLEMVAQLKSDIGKLVEEIERLEGDRSTWPEDDHEAPHPAPP